MVTLIRCSAVAIGIDFNISSFFFFFCDGTLSPEKTAEASKDFVALERICKYEEMEFMIQNYSAQR